MFIEEQLFPTLRASSGPGEREARGGAEEESGESEGVDHPWGGLRVEEQDACETSHAIEHVAPSLLGSLRLFLSTRYCS